MKERLGTLTRLQRHARGFWHRGQVSVIVVAISACRCGVLHVRRHAFLISKAVESAMKTYNRFMRSSWVWSGIVGLTLFLIAYPNPVKFLRTVIRALNPPIEPAAVAAIGTVLPNDPARVEEWVTEHITYDANDYAGWGVIEYFATPTEVLQRGKGPCYGRAVVLASILAEKDIPYRIYATVGHVWVDYAGRQSRRLIENSQLAQFRWENGQWHFQGVGSLEMMVGGTKLYWDQIPLLAKIVLLTPIGAVVTLRWQFWRRSKPRAD